MQILSAHQALEAMGNQGEAAMPAFASMIRLMLKTGARMSDNHVPQLKDMMLVYLAGQETFSRFSHQHVAEARAIATWINSLS